MSDSSQAGRCRIFRELHRSGCFVIPNPWDLGSATALVQLGFRALATSSAGLAWTLGRRDHGVRVAEKLAHLRSLSDCVEVPVNADFEGGFAVGPTAVAANVAAAVATGIAGLSIEDSTGDHLEPLLDRALAVERVRAAREAIDRSGTGVLLTGRSEGFLVGRPDLADTIGRLIAYADAGAECLFAPGLRTTTDIKTVVEALAPRPVNVLVVGDSITVTELEQLGVRRVSVGGGLARAAWTGFLHAATEIAQRGTFTGLGRAASFADINGLFGPR
jgi:2-methylisocitrate lyase-like PEP mutase family enzyme